MFKNKKRGIFLIFVLMIIITMPLAYSGSNLAADCHGVKICDTDYECGAPAYGSDANTQENKDGVCPATWVSCDVNINGQPEPNCCDWDCGSCVVIPATETSCTDNVDNDGDTFKDYADSDCSFTLNIAPNPANPTQEITFTTTPSLTNVVIKDNVGCSRGTTICSFGSGTSCKTNAPDLGGNYRYFACLGENTPSKDLAVPSGHCSASSTHSDNDETTPARYNHAYPAGSWQVTDCNTMDWDNCLCPVSSQTLSRTCKDYRCEGSACKDYSDWKAGEWTCDSTKATNCDTQYCQATGETTPGSLFYCYNSNSGTLTWSKTKEASETACSDGFDNDCDNLIDCDDNNCGASCCTPSCPTNCGQNDGCGGTCPTTDVGTGYKNECDNTDICGKIRTVNPNYNSCDLSSNTACGTETECNDGWDNDCDGAIECYDTDCLGKIGPAGRKCCQLDTDCSVIKKCSGYECVDAKGGASCCMDYCECRGGVEAPCAYWITDPTQCSPNEAIIFTEECLTSSCLTDVRATTIHIKCKTCAEGDPTLFETCMSS